MPDAQYSSICYWPRNSGIRSLGRMGAGETHGVQHLTDPSIQLPPGCAGSHCLLPDRITLGLCLFAGRVFRDHRLISHGPWPMAHGMMESPVLQPSALFTSAFGSRLGLLHAGGPHHSETHSERLPVPTSSHKFPAFRVWPRCSTRAVLRSEKRSVGQQQLR
jgi:hypothetical protein